MSIGVDQVDDRRQHYNCGSVHTSRVITLRKAGPIDQLSGMLPVN